MRRTPRALAQQTDYLYLHSTDIRDWLDKLNASEKQVYRELTGDGLDAACSSAILSQ